MQKPHILRNSKKEIRKKAAKTSITQRFWTDLGDQLDWRQTYNWFDQTDLREPNLPINHKTLCNQRDTHFKICK